MSNLRPSKLVLQLALIHGAALGALVALDASMSTGMLVVFVGLLIVPIGVLMVLWRTVTASSGTRSFVASSTAAKFVVTTLTFSAPVLVGIVASHFVSQSRITEAQRWCESLASKIEDWRAAHGEYPESIQGSELVVDPPKLCDTRWLYSSRDGTYTLSFYDERGFDSIWSYDPRARTWRHTN